MQTPRNFQTFAHTQKCTWNKCPNRARPGKDTCKQHRNSKTQLARKSMSRLLQWYAEHRPHEHESLESLISKLPSSPPLLHAAVSEAIARAHDLLRFDGPGDSKLHKGIYRDVEVAASALARQKEKRDPILLAETFETLSDLGTFDPLDLSKPLKFCWAAIGIYWDAEEYRRLGRAICAYGQTLRLLGRVREAGSIMHWGRNILIGRCRADDPQVFADLALALSLSMRFTPCYADERRVADLYLLRKLTDKVATPEINVIRHQTEAGHFISLGDTDLALDEARKIDDLRCDYHFQPYAASMFERAKIEALKKARRFGEAARLIGAEYYSLYLNRKHLYTYNTLKAWIENRTFGTYLELSLKDLPKPTFASAFFTHSPRN